jgi:hypothetical protein
MAKSKPKIQKRLAKLVLAALLCSGGVQMFISPSVVYADTNGGEYGTVTKDGVEYKINDDNAYGHYSYYMSGEAVVANSKYGDSAWTVMEKENPIKGYDVTLKTSGDLEDVGFFGGWGEYAATEVSGNKVTVDGEANNWTVVAGGYLSGGYYYAGDVLDTVTVKDNVVTVKSGSVGTVVGGFNAGIWIDDGEVYVPGTTTGNQVIINGGQIGMAVGGMGGESIRNDSFGGPLSLPDPVSHATITDNTVTVKDGTVMSVTGGFAQVFGDGDTSVSGNTVTIEGGTVLGAIGGEVYVDLPDKEAELKGTITASDNTVNVKGGTVGTVVGGSSEPYYGSANNNTVNINGGTIAIISEREPINPSLDPQDPDEVPESVTTQSPGMVYGGLSLIEASGNTVTIGKDANVENALIVGGGISPEYSEYYAYATLQEPDNDNMAELKEFMDTLKQAKADNNTVNILGPANVAGLFGGFLFTDTGLGGGKGNTLNVAAKNVSAYTVGGFQNMNFYLPKDIANGDTMLTVKTPGSISEFEKMVGNTRYGMYVEMPVLINKYGAEFVGLMMNSSASGGRIAIDMDKDGNIINPETGEVITKPKPTDLKGVTFGVAALQGVSLKKGDTVNLIVDKNGLTTDSKLKTADSATLAKAKFLAPHNLATDSQYELSIKKKDETTIITTVDDIKEVTPTPKPDSSDRLKSPVETRIAAVSLVNAGADQLAGQGFRNAADAASDDKANGGFNSFVAVSGSKLREDSGSHVDVKGINMNLGFARELTNSKGKLVFGPVVEYGRGSYDSYQDSGIHGDGNTHYWGIGVLAKQVNNSGLYYEGSLRAGKTSSDYDADLSPVTHASYDSDATYWAAHLGIGKLQDIGKDNTLDYYGKYFYSHTGGDSVTIHATAGDERMDFSSVNSHRLRVGARVTHKLNENNKIYGGLGYQYEFKGNARATYNGGSTPSPTVKGSSGLLELGWQVKPGKGPMSIDLGVTGWVGKQRGVTANVQANWTF